MDANVFIHQSWIGMAQPDGLVVTAPALKAAEANIAWPVDELQDQIRAALGTSLNVGNLRAFYEAVLGWRDDELVGGDQLPDGLKIALDGDLLVPDLALRSLDQEGAFALLVNHADRGQSLDRALEQNPWAVSAQQRFERLLVESGVHVGLLTNGAEFRLVYAPKGQSPGTIKFLLADMLTTDGRQLLGAFVMLLNRKRLLTLEPGKRLADLLHASREFQNTVSAALRQQILSALRELLDGFQHADRVAGGRILGELRRGHLQEVYSGLVSVLMRTVFVLYAEEKRLLPIDSSLYDKSYSLTRLHAQLSEDWDRHGDTLYDRYGAWARLITLFRVLHNGLIAAEPEVDGSPPSLLKIPARRGDFFSPDTHPFLEGRPPTSHWMTAGQLTLPRISDGVVFRVLDALLVLHGERLQYKGLDVEHIGSVYEGLMGFEVEVAEGPSLALSNLVVVDLEKLLGMAGAERVRWLKEECGVDLKDKLDAEVKAAKQVAQLHQALARRSSGGELIAVGSLYLQPGEERRRTGSHYTPRKLTQPIVETTLRPVLERLGPDATAEQILSIRVCDPAMGSGAFLVEACRQLGARLVAAWRRSGQLPALPPDESPEVHGQRLVAQRCLYGVDKNPLAVNLARLSLWLETFAKDHPFTFVDHLLRHGDSLVGLTREQITAFHWDVSKRDARRLHHLEEQVKQRVDRAEELRKRIHAQGDPPDTAELKDLWERSNEELSSVRLIADVIVATFFANANDKLRAQQLDAVTDRVLTWLSTGSSQAELLGLAHDLREGKRGVPAFHWDIEFPEVFSRPDGGFDALIGNPPYLGGSRLSTTLGAPFENFLKTTWPLLVGKIDLVVFFLHRAASLLRSSGAVGFIATYRVADGANALVGLRPLTIDPWMVYWAQKERLWPGDAKTRISLLAFRRRTPNASAELDGHVVRQIACDLRASTDLSSAADLRANDDQSFLGAKPDSLGFLLADEERGRLLQQSPGESAVIRRYLIGSDILRRPLSDGSRWIVDFTGIDEETASSAFPLCFRLVTDRVRPGRMALKRAAYRDRWWQFTEPQHRAHLAARRYKRVLGISRVTKYVVWQWVDPQQVIADKVAFVVSDDDLTFGVLHSCFHEYWALRRGGKFGAGGSFSYAPTACFRSFPFPQSGQEAAGAIRELSASISAVRSSMARRDSVGLTEIYNRFHGRNYRDPDVEELRSCHVSLDAAVARAYGWPELDLARDWRLTPGASSDDDGQETDAEDGAEEWRYALSDDAREALLARLLHLNSESAKKDAVTEAAAAEPPPSAPKKGPKGKQAQGELLLGQTTAQGELGMGLPPRKKT